MRRLCPDVAAAPTVPEQVEPARMPNGSTDSPGSRHFVTVALVAHDGARWLHEVLDAVAAQVRPVQQLVAADTGSSDATAAILAERVGDRGVVRLSRSTGFGEAVSRALSTAGPPMERAGEQGGDLTEWVWVLHDDCAPAPDALARLLAVAETSPSAAVLGPKVRGWDERTLLLEVGLTFTGSGRRETGLERDERDQGQHDGVREVLAVGSPGMLVRRDVWDQLGGFDPRLTIFTDDIDLGWRANLAGHRVLVVPDAVVYHVEATSRSRRRVDCARSGHRHLVERRNSLYVMLANLPRRALPLAYVRLTVLGLLRAVGFLLAKRVGYAVDELAALLLVLARPGLLFSARRRRRRSGPMAHRAARHLVRGSRAQLRSNLEALATALAGRQQSLARPLTRQSEAAETGPVADEAESLALGGDGLRRLAAYPGLLLAIGLALVTVAAARNLLVGGTLMGGALLPAPPGVSDLWAMYRSSWHDVGVGSAEFAPPYVAVLGVLATVLFGKPGVAVDVLILGCVPLAGWTAYRAAGHVVTSRAIRLWAASAYALLPAATGAVAAGRLGTAVAVVLLPPTAVQCLRSVSLVGPPARSHVPWAAGVLLAVIAAFTHVAYLLALLLAALLLVTRRGATPVKPLLIMLAVPPLVLLPLTLSVAREPAYLLLEAGLSGPGLTDPSLHPAAQIMLHPGGPGMYRAVLTVGVLLAALGALLRSGRREVAVGSWVVASVALGVGLVLSHAEVTAPGSPAPVNPWPGLPAAVGGAALLVAASVGAEGARERLGASAFSWRQPLVLIVAVIAALTPVLAGVAWIIHGADDPIQRRDPQVLPAYVAAQSETPRRTRTLVLQRDENGGVHYTLLRDTGPLMGTAETMSYGPAYRALDKVVADLLTSQNGGDEAAALARYAVEHVLVAAPLHPEVLEALDSVPGLERVSTQREGALWAMRGTQSRLWLRDASGAEVTPLPSGQVGAATTLQPGEPGRVLVLAEQADRGWQASLDGRELQPVTVGWAQGFEVPPRGGRLALEHTDDAAGRVLLAQAVLAVAAVVMALPGARPEERREPAEVVSHTPRRRAAGRRAAPGRRGRRGARGAVADQSPGPSRSRRRS